MGLNWNQLLNLDLNGCHVSLCIEFRFKWVSCKFFIIMRLVIRCNVLFHVDVYAYRAVNPSSVNVTGTRQ